MAAQEQALRTRNIKKVIDKEKITLSLNVKSWRRMNTRLGDMTKL